MPQVCALYANFCQDLFQSAQIICYRNVSVAFSPSLCAFAFHLILDQRLVGLVASRAEKLYYSTLGGAKTVYAASSPFPLLGTAAETLETSDTSENRSSPQKGRWQNFVVYAGQIPLRYATLLSSHQLSIGSHIINNACPLKSSLQIYALLLMKVRLVGTSGWFLQFPLCWG